MCSAVYGDTGYDMGGTFFGQTHFQPMGPSYPRGYPMLLDWKTICVLRHDSFYASAMGLFAGYISIFFLVESMFKTRQSAHESEGS